MKFVQPSELNGKLKAPPSKSLMQRAVAASVLASGETAILNPCFCDDSYAALGIAKNLGKTITVKQGKVLLDGEKNVMSKRLNCNESGLSLRMFSAIAGLFDAELELTGQKGLLSRPVGVIEKPLKSLGVKCGTNRGFAPVFVKGPMAGGSAAVDGSLSSQFLTGLLTALPSCSNDSELIVSNLNSKPYVEMTVSLLKKFKVKIRRLGFEKFFIQANQEFKAPTLTIEGDWSSASFLLVGAAINGQITLSGLSKNSFQADKAVVGALKKAGAVVKQAENQVKVSKDSLNGFEFDATDCPDLFPPLIVLACNCRGKSVIYGADRLKFKESDRAKVLLGQFKKIGAKISINKSALEVIGSKIKGGTFDSYNDHRIAMAGAIAGLSSARGVKIIGEKCVSKSYPSFFKDMDSLGCT